MAIITFYSNTNKPIGKTLSIAAITSYMGVERNNRILLISTSFEDTVLKEAFEREDKQPRNSWLGSFNKGKQISISSGMDGLIKLYNSNRLSKEQIKDYTTTIYTNRFDIIYGLQNINKETYEKVQPAYPEIIKAANQVYDFVFVDLDTVMDQKYKEEILENSDIIVYCIEQKIKAMDQYMEYKANKSFCQKGNVVLLLTRFDERSKYNAKNIARYIGEKKPVYTIPYNTLYFEASMEGKVSDYFLENRKLSEDAKNKLFMDQVKRTSEGIIYRLQEQQMKL